MNEIRSFKEGDESSILELFQMSYSGRQMPLPYWQWRFRINPLGQGIISLSWDDKILVAHYAVTNISLSIMGRNYSAGLSGTTMSHPTYRGRGLFPSLARYTFQGMSDRGMVMVWGFPNSVSHRYFIDNLEWQDIYEIPVLRLQLAYQKMSSFSVSSSVYELFDVDDRFDRLWETCRKDYDIIVCRHRAYINWRYFSNPVEKYRLVTHVENDDQIKGYAVFKRYGNEIQIVDLLISKKDVSVGRQLIHYIIAQAYAAGAKSISLWLNVTHPLHHVLEKIGFRPEGPITYFCGLLLNSQHDESLYNFRRWYFTMSDSDVY